MNRDRIRNVKSNTKTRVPSLQEALSLPALDTSIDIDLPCIRCAYNLKSKLTGDWCSECGAAVLETFDRPRLAYVPEEIFISTRRGIQLTANGGIIAGVFYLIGVCADVSLVQSLFKSILLASVAVVMGVAFVVHSVGAWILATPHSYYKWSEVIPRILIRLNLLTLATALALGTIFLMFKIMAGWVSMSFQTLMILGCSIHGVLLSSILLGVERRCAGTRAGRLWCWKILRVVLVLLTALFVTEWIEFAAQGKWEGSKLLTGTTVSAVTGLTIFGVFVLAIIARRTCRIVDDEWRASKLLSAWRRTSLAANDQPTAG